MARVVMRSPLPLPPTAPLKVIPPEFVTVSAPISVPIAPLTVTTSVVLKVIFEGLLPATPVMEARVIGVAAPVPSVKVTPSLSVTAPSVIRPVVGLRVLLTSKVTGTAMYNGLAVAVMLCALTVTADAFAIDKPPKKLNTSVAKSPKRIVPVL